MPSAVQDSPKLRRGIGVPQHRGTLLARDLGPGLIYAGLSGSSVRSDGA